MFPHGRFSQSATKDYADYVPSPLRLKFNGERIWRGEYVLADIFGLQRHLSRIDFEDLGV